MDDEYNNLFNLTRIEQKNKIKNVYVIKIMCRRPALETKKYESLKCNAQNYC